MRTQAITRDLNSGQAQTTVCAYHQLRIALETFNKSPADLHEQQRLTVMRKAASSFGIESLVLASQEAGNVLVPAEQVAAAVHGIRDRYPDESAFRTDLQRNGLDEDILWQALYRELLFDAVMQRVGARHATVSDIDVRSFYAMHGDRFCVPERRVARHILITINEGFAENSRTAVITRMTDIIARLGGRVNRFADLARKYSECPTALNGGKLGEISRGQLFPELDVQLFSMGQGEIGGAVETDIGLHLLYCERIVAARTIPLGKVRNKIRVLLETRNQRDCQKVWLAGLGRSPEPVHKK